MSVKTWYEIRRKGKCVNLVSNKKTAQYLVNFMKKGEYQIVPVKVEYERKGGELNPSFCLKRQYDTMCSFCGKS